MEGEGEGELPKRAGQGVERGREEEVGGSVVDGKGFPM